MLASADAMLRGANGDRCVAEGTGASGVGPNVVERGWECRCRILHSRVGGDERGGVSDTFVVRTT
jgi:hypothetical protein